MRSALGYLALHSTRNRILRQVRRLRTPRYAVALLLGLAYLWVVAGRQRPSSEPPDVSPADRFMAGLRMLMLVALPRQRFSSPYTWWRHTSKSDSLFDVLQRITAARVVRIEIVDGATLGIPSLSGQVANIFTTGGAIIGRYE